MHLHKRAIGGDATCTCTRAPSVATSHALARPGQSLTARVGRHNSALRAIQNCARPAGCGKISLDSEASGSGCRRILVLSRISHACGTRQSNQDSICLDRFINVGTARVTSEDADDEFDYALEGGKRDGGVHKQVGQTLVFKATEMPKHLVTRVQQLNSLAEAGEDSEEGQEESGEVVAETSITSQEVPAIAQSSKSAHAPLPLNQLSPESEAKTADAPLRISGTSASPAQVPKTDEWESANQRVKAQASDAFQVGSALAEPTLLCSDAVTHLLNDRALDLHRDRVLSELPSPPSFLQKLFCIGAPELNPSLKDQQVRVLSLGHVRFSEEDTTHLRLLNAVYQAYTGKKSNHRFGSHWAEIGFQGQDPATDLRSCGIFGLLQLYQLYQHHQLSASRLHSLSRSAQEFPLAVVSLNATLWALQALREGRLSRDAVRLRSVTDAATLFYVGTMYTFYDTWHGGGKTMSDSGFVMKELEEMCKRRPGVIFGRAMRPVPP
eukprot:364699-Chlamydomonas_euryale.AAC.13